MYCTARGLFSPASSLILSRTSSGTFWPTIADIGSPGRILMMKKTRVRRIRTVGMTISVLVMMYALREDMDLIQKVRIKRYLLTKNNKKFRIYPAGST